MGQEYDTSNFKSKPEEILVFGRWAYAIQELISLYVLLYWMAIKLVCAHVE